MTDSLKLYQAPDSIDLWNKVPVKAKAAVLAILYETENSDLNVVLTVRSSKLRSYPSQAAFPGGRCDYKTETAWQTALREAEEEIGFDPAKFEFEQLCNLPCYLSRHLLVVVPCVCLIRNSDGSAIKLQQIAPKISTQEVDTVFSFPLKNLLDTKGPYFVSYSEGDWLGRVYGFYQLDIQNDDSSFWIFTDKTNDGSGDSIESAPVVGLTAHMLIDLARIAYPQIEFFSNSDYGFEPIIHDMLNDGKFNRTRM